jgi:hypothetical protein
MTRIRLAVVKLVVKGDGLMISKRISVCERRLGTSEPF